MKKHICVRFCVAVPALLNSVQIREIHPVIERRVF